MTIAFRTANNLSAHAVCVAAGIRDGLRTAQYYVRDLHNVDGQGTDFPHQSTFLSRVVAGWARNIDGLMTRGGNLAIALFLPKWRHLPSPFAPRSIDDVAHAIQHNSLIHNPLFNAYFFRSCQNILAHWSGPPYLVLEHRIDAARRNLALLAPEAERLKFLSHTLLALIEAAPIARHGAVKPSGRVLNAGDPNVAVCATACLALLLAEEGGEIKGISDGEFLAIVGALIEPKISEIQAAASARDVLALATSLRAICELY